MQVGFAEIGSVRIKNRLEKNKFADLNVDFNFLSPFQIPYGIYNYKIPATTYLPLKV